MKKMKKVPKEITLEVPTELRNMAVDISFMRGYLACDIEKTLMKALRVGLAHLLVLEEEEAKWRMNQM